MKKDILSQVEIENRLKYKNKIILKDILDSTNTEAKKYIGNDSNNGTLIVTNEQTGGRGRNGKSFFSPKDSGIYMSLILFPKDISFDISSKITIAVAVAIIKAMEKICNKDLQIKWVNDIFLDDKKIGGILTETNINFKENRIENVIIGIGINVSTISFPEEIKNIASSIFCEDDVPKNIDRNFIISEIINEVMDIMKDLTNPKILEIYRKYSYLTNKFVTFTINNNIKEGKVLGINDNGFLIVEISENEILELNSGEISVICKK